MNLGYDYIVIETNDIVSFLKETKKHQLTLFHLHQLDALRYSFYDISHLLCIYLFKKV